MKKPILSIIGPNKSLCTKQQAIFAAKAGKMAVELGYRVMTGGDEGVMEAAIRGAKSAMGYVSGDTIALTRFADLKSQRKATRHSTTADVVLHTGLGHARNLLIARGDVVLAIGGGAGTLSEIALAWTFNRPVIAWRTKGWSGTVAGRQIDNRRPGEVVLSVGSVAELEMRLKSLRTSL